MAAVHYHGMRTLSWHAHTIMACTHYHGMHTLSWHACTFMACMHYHGMHALSWHAHAHVLRGTTRARACLCVSAHACASFAPLLAVSSLCRAGVSHSPTHCTAAEPLPEPRLRPFAAQKSAHAPPMRGTGAHSKAPLCWLSCSLADRPATQPPCLQPSRPARDPACNPAAQLAIQPPCLQLSRPACNSAAQPANQPATQPPSLQPRCARTAWIAHSAQAQRHTPFAHLQLGQRLPRLLHAAAPCCSGGCVLSTHLRQLKLRCMSRLLRGAGVSAFRVGVNGKVCLCGCVCVHVCMHRRVGLNALST